MSGPDKYAEIPATRRSIRRLEAQNVLLRLTSLDLTDLVDNSTGVAASGGVAVNILRHKFTYATGSTLAQKAAADTAFGTVNNAIAVLKGLYNSIATPALGLTLTGGNGNVVTPGTIPAVTKAVTGSDGATEVALARAGGNAALKSIRDNLSTLYILHNRFARTFAGIVPVTDQGEGVGSVSLTLLPVPSTGAPVANTGDAMPKAFLDAELVKIANNIAFLGTKYNEVKTYIDDNRIDLGIPVGA